MLMVENYVKTDNKGEMKTYAPVFLVQDSSIKHNFSKEFLSSDSSIWGLILAINFLN